MPEYIRIKQRYRLTSMLCDQRDDLATAIKELVWLVKKALPTTVWRYYPKNKLDPTQLARLAHLFAIMNVASLRKPIQEFCELDNARFEPEDQYWQPPYAVESVDIVVCDGNGMAEEMLYDPVDLLQDMESLAEQCAQFFGDDLWYAGDRYNALLAEHRLAAKLAPFSEYGKVYPLFEDAKMADHLAGPKRKAPIADHPELPDAKRAKPAEGAEPMQGE